MLNGVSGDKVGGKIIKSIADSIIHPENQYLFSMTGKAAPGHVKKIAFNQFTEIIGVIFATCRRADTNYSLKECKNDLTYKIFKHGNSKRNRYKKLLTIS